MHELRKLNKIYKQRENGTLSVSTENKKPTRTQRQFQEQCDINKIMSKYAKTGMLTHMNFKKGVFGDFSEVKDYQQSLETVMKAEESFALLPAEIRNKFQNDIPSLLKYLNDPSNNEEAIKLGLKQIQPATDSQKIVNAINKLKQNDEQNDDKQTKTRTRKQKNDSDE